MIVLSIGSFTFIFWLLKRKLLVDYSVRPPGIECDTVNRNIEMPFYEQILKQRAYKEAEQRQDIDILSNNINEVTSRQGALQCFCQY